VDPRNDDYKFSISKCLYSAPDGNVQRKCGPAARRWNRAPATFADCRNNQRYHEGLDNLTPADVYFGGQAVLNRGKITIGKTIEQRRRWHRQTVAWTLNQMSRTIA
jgi:hypothetical protein